jgi:hypothetical protein
VRCAASAPTPSVPRAPPSLQLAMPSRFESTRPTSRRAPDAGQPAWRPVAVGLAGAVLVGLVALVWYCRSLLLEAAAGRAPAAGGAGFWCCVGGFLLATSAAILLQAWRVAEQVAGPEYRLRRALQRARAGDVDLRVTLRRGDPLAGLAHDCNELLAWLSKNPPHGVRTSDDVVEVGTMDTQGNGE